MMIPEKISGLSPQEEKIVQKIWDTARLATLLQVIGPGSGPRARKPGKVKAHKAWAEFENTDKKAMPQGNATFICKHIKVDSHIVLMYIAKADLCHDDNNQNI